MIPDRVAAVRERIARAAERAARPPGDVTLVAISKTHPPEAVRAAFDAGVRDFGENRVQEAGPKIAATAKELLWVLVTSTLVLLWGSIPTWAGYRAETDDLRFRGIYFDSQDYAVHISMMEAGITRGNRLPIQVHHGTARSRLLAAFLCWAPCQQTARSAH